jgi:hypothetical protein
MSSSSDDDQFLRLHAKAIADALHQRDAAEHAAQSYTTKSDRERLIHETYVALCYDDPRVESDLACQYLATALLDPNSPLALSGPLVEGIRKLCAKQETALASGTEGESLTASKFSVSSKGSALLAWAIGARIPLLCCQASEVSQVLTFLGSYRPPPPPNTLDDDGQTVALTSQQQQQLGKEADRVAAMLSQPPEEANATINDNTPLKQQEEEDEVWAAESDPSDFEFESGFTYEQQLADVDTTYAEWLIDRSDPLKLSKPPAATTTWKQVRHAVMELTSQLNYRQLASLFSNQNQPILPGNRGLSSVLTQLTMTLLVPPSSTTAGQPSIFDSPDDEEDVLQPQRQLQAMAWYPLWVLRDAAAAGNNHAKCFSDYLTMLQTLIAVDAAQPQKNVAPATYVGLASLSALCQQFITDSASSGNGNNTVERYRELRRSVWETCDDLTHVMEQEDKIHKAAKGKDESSCTGQDHWSVWTLLPLFEILTNQRLQSGATLVSKAESLAQRHHNQQQQWSAALLQSGLFRLWLLRCQAVRQGVKTESSAVLWQYMRRSLLYVIAQSMPAKSALGKYAWRFPNFTSVIEIGESFRREGNDKADSSTDIDDILWNMLAMELAESVASTAPTIQWKTTAKNKPSIAAIKPLPSRLECQKVCWEGFQELCKAVVRVLELACQEENKKENLATNDAAATEKQGTQEEEKLQHQVLLRSFQRFVNSVAACSLLANIFVNNLAPEPRDGSDGTIAKCLDDVQSALSQCKAPSPNLAKGSSPKAKDKDRQGAELETSRAAKEQGQHADLHYEIHMVRKELKVLRSILASQASAESACLPVDLTSSSKSD